jgi:hypothetical protein
MLSMITENSGYLGVIVLVTSMPLVPGMFTSISTRCGRSR